LHKNTATQLSEIQDKKPSVGPFFSPKKLTHDTYMSSTRFVHQCAKKVVSNSLGLVDFAIGLVIFVPNLRDGQVLFLWGNSNYRRIVINPANQKRFGAS